MITAAAIALSLTYAALLGALLVGLYRTASRPRPSGAYSEVSVVVAFRNEAKNLPALVSSLNAQRLAPHLWEVIFVDDGSTDGSAATLEGIAKSFSSRLIRLQGAEGKKQAVAEGVKSARFGLVALTDSDCQPSPRWLEEVARNGDFAVTQRPVVAGAPGSAMAMLEGLDYASLMAVSAGSFGLGRPTVAASANLTFRKDLVEVSTTTLRARIPSGDDMFLLHTAKRQKGNRLTFSLEANGLVRTRFEGGLGGFIQRRKRWASKALAYTDPDTILAASVVLLLNLLIVLLALAALLGLSSARTLAMVWLAKTLADFPLLYAFLKRTEQLKLLLVFIPLQLIYPFYTSYSAIAGLLGGQTWKGRTINRRR